ncbi:hypothetical protein [Streptomyces sp. NBC_00847]|uniref:hypothetical protein n=1 Tax=unclassified Streptomyces TaxID=2593676 RepID=UPI0022520A21|nr:hypothetical protein [Streptomyces sp. NBC_00847]MCX4884241.1 hypothetical protein [Streptomyces sp. NBC_00847]
MTTGRGRTGAAVALALMAVLSGCGGNGGRDDGSGEGAEPSTSRTSSRASDAGAPPESVQPPASMSPTISPTSGSATADGTDAGACFDGRCEIAVSKPMTIKIDGRLGVSDLRITQITDDAVVLQSSGSGMFLSTSVGEGGTGGLNELGFRVKSLHEGTAVLEFFPKD